MNKEIKEEIIEIFEKNHQKHKNCNTRSGECSCEAEEFANQISELFEEEKQGWVEEIEKYFKENFYDEERKEYYDTEDMGTNYGRILEEITLLLKTKDE